MKYGLLRIAAAKPLVKAGDVKFNTDNIITMAAELVRDNVAVVVFPELSITGYTCADLFEQSLLLESAKDSVCRIAAESEKWPGLCLAVGLPIKNGTRLYNCAAVVCEGKILGVVPKSYLPNYGEFYEKRWFAPGLDVKSETVNISDSFSNIPFGTDILFEHFGVKFGIEICEDLWVPQPPSCKQAMAGAELILNLSATDELIGKHDYLLSLLSQQSARCRVAYAYASAGYGESSTDLAFSGNCIIAENGSIVAQSPRFNLECYFTIADVDIANLQHDRTKFNSFSQKETKNFLICSTANAENDQFETLSDEELFRFRKLFRHPFVDERPEDLEKRCDEISSIQAWGLATRLKAIGCRHAVIGVSGGLDSTLALLVTTKAFDMLGLSRKGIFAVTMPGFGTSRRTKGNADRLMELLDVTSLEIPIGPSVEQHFKDIGHDPAVKDVTYENSQARERTQILMDLANKENGIVIGTGDLSELALGWCTYNGDQMSMYAVNASIPKTLVRFLVEGYAKETSNKELREVLMDIVDTPVSPELLPVDSQGGIAQKTEDLVGPYELHDFFLYQVLRHGTDPRKIYKLAVKAFEGEFDRETIKKWLKTFIRRFFNQQFKRSCMPDGVKVGSVCLSPRGDWRMPSDASSRLWLESLEDLD